MFQTFAMFKNGWLGETARKSAFFAQWCTKKVVKIFLFGSIAVFWQLGNEMSIGNFLDHPIILHELDSYNNT